MVGRGPGGQETGVRHGEQASPIFIYNTRSWGQHESSFIYNFKLNKLVNLMALRIII